jgi:mannose-6-phosphate isomerase-like protein (cupin superfamily)
MRMELDVAHPLLLLPGEGETVADQPEKTLRLLADHDELALTWFRYAGGETGPELHIHKRHTDAFYVLSGEVSFALGPDGAHEVRGRTGTFVAAPAGVAHTFANETSEEATFLNIHAPNMGFADMLRARRDGRTEDAERFDQFPPPPDGGRPVSDATISPPGEGERIQHMLVKVSSEEIDGVEIDCGPGFGPGPHTHEVELDSFYILEGELDFTLGDQIVRAGPGTFVSAPPGAVHGFKSAGPGRARFLNLHTPAGGFVDSFRKE